MKTIKKYDLDDTNINLGPEMMDKVPNLYKACHGLFLPTLLESFSGTYIECMQFQKPIFTSDRDFSKDVCGDCAYYFDPHSPEDIINTIMVAFDEKDEMKKNAAEAGTWIASGEAGHAAHAAHVVYEQKIKKCEHLKNNCKRGPRYALYPNNTSNNLVHQKFSCEWNEENERCNCYVCTAKRCKLLSL